MSLAMQIKDRHEYESKLSPVVFPKETSVLEASKAMSSRNIGSCVIIDTENRPIGIVTERDLMAQVIAKELDAANTSLSEIMSTNLKLAKPNDKVIDWLRQMSNERFRRVPVVDTDGKLINIMTQGDFVSYTWPELHFGKHRQFVYIIASFIIYTLCMLAFIKFV